MLLHHVVSLIIIWCSHFRVYHALKIFEHSLASSEYQLFSHRTAKFGPSANDYNVSGRLQLMLNYTGCNIDAFRVNSSHYHQIYQDDIVLVLRGDCYFSDKAYHAQLLGAIGVVVGNDAEADDQDRLVPMRNVNDEQDIKIPSIFVLHDTYTSISQLLLSQNGTVDEQDDVVYAMLDSDGEDTSIDWTYWRSRWTRSWIYVGFTCAMLVFFIPCTRRTYNLLRARLCGRHSDALLLAKRYEIETTTDDDGNEQTSTTYFYTVHFAYDYKEQYFETEQTFQPNGDYYSCYDENDVVPIKFSLSKYKNRKEHTVHVYAHHLYLKRHTDSGRVLACQMMKQLWMTLIASVWFGFLYSSAYTVGGIVLVSFTLINSMIVVLFFMYVFLPCLDRRKCTVACTKNHRRWKRETMMEKVGTKISRDEYEQFQARLHGTDNGEAELGTKDTQRTTRNVSHAIELGITHDMTINASQAIDRDISL